MAGCVNRFADQSAHPTQLQWALRRYYANDSIREMKTMRAILVLIGLIALGVVAALATGMLSINQQHGGSLPTVSVQAQGGQLPSYSAETGSVGVGNTAKTVEVPTVEMKKATVVLPTIEVKQAPGASPTPAAK
jgi:hypothetical protein